MRVMTKKSAVKSKAPAPTKTAAKTAAKAPEAVKAAPADKGEKIAKAQIVEMMATRTGLSKKEAGSAFDAAMDVVVGALKAGKAVGLPGLGTLGVKATAARTGVRPGTSEKIEIPAGKKVSYKVAVDLKSSI